MSLGIQIGLRATRAIQPLPVRLVCAQRTKFQKPPIHVYLREDIPGIGEKGEIALVNLKRARNHLVPLGLAYYVPRIKGKPILPEGWQPRIRETDVVLETITPAFSTIKIENRQTTNTNLNAATPAREKRVEQEAEKLTVLSTIKSLHFERVRMRPDSTRIYGSVSQEDIVAELLDKHGIALDREVVQMDVRIKDVGSHKVKIALGAAKDLEIDVVVADSPISI